MQKVIIDTNVIVSSLIQRGFPHRIIFDLFLEDKIYLCTSQPLLNEYYEVLARPKFTQFQDFAINAKIVLSNIETKSTCYQPEVILNLLTDKDDNKILELAETCKADYIITGNTNDFTFSAYKQTKIVTPRDYWDNYRPVE
ncbi:MAG: putative toxin-antitoxin system toxin component, PIN family [Treponema sp.]|nr:putative toxin-antitoxin system toxin component, PIN family [Treponema sp.]